MKPEQIEFIGFNPNFVDHWVVLINWQENGYETISASDNPSHPQGVFSSTPFFVDNLDEENTKSWEDLPETLQKFLINYIKE